MKTALFSLVLAVSYQSLASWNNLTSQVAGNAIGLANLEYSRRLSENLTLGITGANGHGKLGPLDLSGSAYGVIARRYFKPALEQDSWYLLVGVEKRDFMITRRDQDKDYKAESKSTVGSIGGGYHWFWQSFNIGLGGAVTNQPSLEMKTDAGEVHADRLNPGLSLDFTIGGKF
ncbi:MAG: hypothetical protein KF789_04945 [Bdellovibrionaceae bacterium]|nr:hypothetical protein [Pseudobdellovibrionaceae bacterium]